MVESSKVTGVTDFICVAAIDSLSAHEVKEVDGIWGVGCSGGEVVVEVVELHARQATERSTKIAG